ncbi:MAG: PKD domain-containing protein, partial [Bacteroidota bacterium]
MQKIFVVLILILLVFLACEPEEVLPEFEADFVMSAETIEVGDTIAFGEKVQGFPASFRWLFEGGQPSISTARKQTVSYRSKGTFKVTLWVESEDSREDSVVKEITVTEGLKAQFSASKTIIRQDSSLTFSDQSTGEPESWSWFFESGEPNTSSEQNPTILYPDTGIFSVSLVVGKGEILDSVSWQNYIRVVDDTTAITQPNDSLTFPTVNCDATNTSGLAPLEVFFIAVATDPNGNDNDITYSWDFKDGNTATGNKVSHIFTETGNYTVELTVMDSEGNEVTCEEILIEVKPRPGAPTVSCSANPESGPAPLNVNFSVAATDPDGGPLQYFWDFGDGDTTSAQNLSHTYTMPGEYQAEVTVIDEDGLVSTCKKTISVSENNLPPSLNCSITPTTGSAPLSIEVAAIAEDPDGDDEALTYLWTFGELDSNTSSTANFTFDSAGTYQVTLIVTDEAGMTSSCEETITVSGLDNQGPMASCEATPTTGEAPLTVTFTGGGLDTDGNIIKYSWNFGDESPISELQNPTHEYTNEGTFTASLVVEDNQGARDTCIKIITVSSNVCPQPQLQASPLSGESPLVVNFSGALSTDSDGIITSYLWNFGDGNSAEGETATHIYQTNGQYVATLTVTDNEGCQKSTFVTINVGSDNICPQAVIVTNNQTGTAPLSIIFDGTSSTDADGLITSFVWRFGDGDTAAGPDVSHTYETAGVFTAILEITDDGGCRVSDSLAITVSPPPSPPSVNCSANPESGIAPLEVSLSASGADSDGFIVSYDWDFGDGNSGSGENVTHTYAEGTYIAEVIATDNDGLSDTCVAFIAVGAAPNQPPSVSCNASVLTGSPPLSINFSSLASDTDGTIASYEWAFGDGNTSTAQNPIHIYQAEGNYLASVVATDDEGARDTCELSISVQAGVNSPPTLSCLPDKTSGKAPLTINFSADASDSDGTIASYRWEFGDGGSSTLEDPSHTFSDAGTYNVRLVVKDNVGDSAVCTNTITVTANQCPSPSIQANPTSGVIPLEVSFDASNSTDPDGTIVSYIWNFGDGDTGMGETTSHTYTEAGNFLATLTVTDNDNCSETANISIIVSSPDNTPPVASCQADETSGKAPFTVNFSGAASTDADGAIAEYTWDFGDSSPVTSGVTQEHVYTTPGTYSATLTVLDDDGASAQCNLEITVTENTNPVASCEVSPTSGNPPLLISVDGTNSSDPDGTVAEYLWTFGDGATSTEASTTHTFASGGDYLVKLVITDNEGGKDSCSTLVSVNNAPEAVCQVTPTEGNAPLTITVNGGSSTDIDGAISEYTWDFGDGSPARTGVSLTHEYTSEGSYTVRLTVLDDDG